MEVSLEDFYICIELVSKELNLPQQIVERVVEKNSPSLKLYKNLIFEKRLACTAGLYGSDTSIAFITDDGSVYIKGPVFLSQNFKQAKGIQNAKQVHLGSSTVAVVTERGALDVFGLDQIKKGGWIDRTFAQRIRDFGVTSAKVHSHFIDYISFITTSGNLYKVYKEGLTEEWGEANVPEEMKKRVISENWGEPILQENLPPIKEYIYYDGMNFAITKDNRVILWFKYTGKKIRYIPGLRDVKQICITETFKFSYNLYAITENSIKYTKFNFSRPKHLRSRTDIPRKPNFIRSHEFRESNVKQVYCHFNFVLILKDGKIWKRSGSQFVEEDIDVDNIQEFQICPDESFIFITKDHQFHLFEY